MPDPSPTAIGQLQQSVRDLHDTFVGAGIDPGDGDARERFAVVHRRIVAWLDHLDKRNKWWATGLTAVLIGVVTAVSIPLVTWLVKLLTAGRL